MDRDIFNLKIYTPSGLELEAEVKSVNLTTSVGEIGILPMHTRYVGVLGEGRLQYTESKSGETKNLIVSGGFCNFINENLLVLADRNDVNGLRN